MFVRNVVLILIGMDKNVFVMLVLINIMIPLVLSAKNLDSGMVLHVFVKILS